MTGTAALVFALTAVVAVGDWMAVAARRRSIEYVLKPLTTIGLIVVAIAITPVDGGVRILFTAALVLSLVGDVALMLPARERLFPVGLGAFLLAHLAYIWGLLLLAGVEGGLSWRLGAVGVVLAIGGAATVGRRVLRSVRRERGELAGPVAGYLGVILVMMVVAWGSHRLLAALGATLFVISDAVLAENEFVRPRPGSHLVVMVTYHLAQALLVLSIVAW